VDKATLRTENGAVINPANNQRLTYGSLSDAASKITPPAQPALKDPKNFKLIGTSIKRLDTPLKVNGTAVFGLDAKVPGMLYAVVAKCPVFGGKVKSFDATKAKAVAGVKNVVQISSGVAVVAEDTWTAMEGRRALEVVWDEGPNANLTSEEITRRFAESMSRDGAAARTQGDAKAALASASKKIEAVYQAPFLSHAPMEPMNATARIANGKVEVWTSSQMQTGARDVAAQSGGVKPEDVDIHFLLMGGGFGRRGGPDFVADAVETSKALGGAPVKVTWSREDDMQHDLYRPASYTRFQAALDAQGWPTAITARVACPPFGPMRNGVAGTAVEGINDMMYEIPNKLIDYHNIDPGIPVSYWRWKGSWTSSRRRRRKTRWNSGASCWRRSRGLWPC
jgi:isoquinoline 1-oxidoreductase subunit beta